MKTKTLLTRFIAGLAVSALLVFAAATLIPDTSPKKTLFEEITGISHNTVIATVKNQPITWEEFLYLVAYDGDSLAQYIEQMGWDADVGGTTLREYIKADALEACKLYAVVRQYAKYCDIELTAEDKADQRAYEQQLIAQLGGDESFRRQMYLTGLSDEGRRGIDSMDYLYTHLVEYAAQPGGKLRPDDQTLSEYAEASGFVSLKVLYLPAETENSEATMAGYLETLRTSADPAADFAAICAELGLDDAPLLIKLDEVDVFFAQAADALEAGQFSDVLTLEAGHYVIWRLDTDMDTVAGYFFGDTLSTAVSGAQVEPVGNVLESFDAAAFYTRLSELRSAMAASLNTVG